MLELLADPTVLVFAGTWFGVLLHRVAVWRICKPKAIAESKAVEESKSAESKSTEDRIFECSVWAARHLEKKLVDAGIIKVIDMEVCENTVCPNCEPTRKASELARRHTWREESLRRQEEEDNALKGASPEGWSAFQNLKKTDPRWRGYTYKDYLFQQEVKNKKEAAQREMLERAQRKTAVNKRPRNSIRIPANVPKDAHLQVVYNPQMLRDELLWTWTTMDGMKGCYRQNVDMENYEMHNGNGQWVSSWTAVYDPDTGEHLGDYRKVNGKSELRNPQAQPISTVKVRR